MARREAKELGRRGPSSPSFRLQRWSATSKNNSQNVKNNGSQSVEIQARSFSFLKTARMQSHNCVDLYTDETRTTSRASCRGQTSVASPYADRKHLAATRQPAQMDGQPPCFTAGSRLPFIESRERSPPQQGASPPCFTAGVFPPQQGASPPSLHPSGSARNTPS